MRVVMVSDVHLVDQDDPVQHAWVRWLDALEADHLVLLGDIFHTWWGYWAEPQPEYRPAIDALRRIRERGISIRFVPGNHDFALGTIFEDELQAHIHGPERVEFSGRSFFLAHGDEVDHSWGYRLLSTIIRGAVFRWLMDGIGARRGTALLRWLAGEHQPRGDTEGGPLLDAQRAWARELHAEGVEVVVMGHLHCPGLEIWDSGCFVQLGDWVEHRTWLVVDDGVATLCRQVGNRAEIIGSSPTA